MKKTFLGAFSCLGGLYLMHYGAVVIGLPLFALGIIVMRKSSPTQ